MPVEDACRNNRTHLNAVPGRVFHADHACGTNSGVGPLQRSISAAAGALAPNGDRAPAAALIDAESPFSEDNGSWIFRIFL